MKFVIEKEGDRQKRVLIAREEEVECSTCGYKEWSRLYFCNHKKVLYCLDCILHKKACNSRPEHEDFKLDEVQIEPHLMDDIDDMGDSND